MTTKRELQGSFGSLLDTLQNRMDPFFPPNLLSRWLGAIGRAAAIARNSAGWNALPDQDRRYSALVGQLDDATRALVMADYTKIPSLEAALGQVEAALAALDAIV